MKPTVLITGNTGYIGTVMAKHFKEASYNVVGLDNDLYRENSLFSSGDEAKPQKQIIKDIRQVTANDLEGVDAVIHLAGLSNDPLGELNPGLTDEINCVSTLQLARLAKSKGIKRFLFSSSCSIYGISSVDFSINETGRLKPLTAYAKAKVDAESGLAKLADENFHPVFMRNATVYGLSPKMRLDLVVNNLTAWAYLKGEIAIMSDGTPWRPIVHVEDLSRAFKTVLEAPHKKIHCQAFNIGSNTENYQVKDIALKVGSAVPEASIKILNKMGPDERTYKVDFSKFKDAFPEFKWLWNVEKGIEALLDAYKRYSLSVDDFESDKYFRVRTIKSLLESGKIDENLKIKGGQA
ncbi:MAG: NAD(P)-dependent oxidoreductase [Candidatus Omnitrophica bacterium]|nr:NAD(P)-dependent oxidoreductase [Candidatus Omnitrophota bacterium]